MNCFELETLLCDYVDATLDASRKTAVDRHLAECPKCAEMARETAFAAAFLKRVPEVEPPPELVTRIVFDLTGGRARVEQRRPGLLAILGRLLEPVLQPRFAMGMAMTILSFSMLARVAGINVRQLSVSDLDPVKVWRTLDDRASRAWSRAVKFYENLQSVYEIRSRLRELTEAAKESTRQTAAPDRQQEAPRKNGRGGTEQ